jgi:hypothetical protein
MARSRLQKLTDNVRDNYRNLTIKHEELRAGYVAIRVSKDESFDANRRVLSGLIGGHGLTVAQVADGVAWNEYWITGVGDTRAAGTFPEDSFWRSAER